MNKRIKTICLAIIFMSCSVCLLAEEAESRVWTSKKGDTLTGSFEKVLFGQVHIKSETGRVVKIPLTSLAEEDRKYASSMGNEANKAKAQRLSNKKIGSSSRVSASGLLTDAQIEELQTTYLDEDKGVTYRFRGSFYQKRLDKVKDRSLIKKYASSGKIPFKITIDFDQFKEVRGKKIYKQNDGTGKFYVLDEEGNVVLKKSMSLSKLCPT